MENKTVYCGSGKKQNEKWIKATVNPDKMREFIEEYQGNKFIRLNINIKDEPDQFGKDVSISIDQWQPDENKSQGEEEDSDLPF